MTTPLHPCENCGADVNPEDVAKRRAGRVQGKLLCAACVEAKIKEIHAAATTKSQSAAAPRAAPSHASSAAVATVPPAVQPAIPPGGFSSVSPPVDEPLSLVAENDFAAERPHAEIRAFSAGTSLAGADRHEQFRRGLVDRATGATRCRSFHAKLTDAALAYMDNQINEWVDAHPDVFIKFASSTIGVFEGKHAEPHVIVTVFY